MSTPHLSQSERRYASVPQMRDYEATNSLDNISERLVQEAIDNISKDRTVIVIAHRLSSIRYADKIVVLDQGRIVEAGKHEELLDERGHYFRLVTFGLNES